MFFLYVIHNQKNGRIKNNLETEGLSGEVCNLVFGRRKADSKVLLMN